MKTCLAARRFVSLVRRAGVRTALLVCGLAAACGEPSRLPTVLPLAPSSEMFLLSGTVTETAPTTSPMIPHALLTLVGINSGTSTTADDNGRFSFGQITGGRFSLVASRDGYQTGTFAIELKRDSDYAIRLAPERPESPQPQDVTETHTATLDWNVPPCQPVALDCYHEYSFITHHSGNLSLRLDWTGDAELVLSTNNWDEWFRATSTSKTIETSVRIRGGERYTVYVNYNSGTGPAKYTLVMTHPN
jgi:hypothetical protein